MTDIEKARQQLSGSLYTCVIRKGCAVYTSTERGVKPLLEWLENDSLPEGFSAADKVVGKAAAFLYVLLGAASVYADVISIPAIEVLDSHGIEIQFGKSTAAIRNRTDTGFCPLETAVAEINEPATALFAIKERLKQLSIQNNNQ